MADTERADLLLVARGLCDSREQAKRLIMAGAVLCGTERVSKPSTKLSIGAELTVKESPKFVGRGGLKLEGALEAFGVDPTGRVCLDVGSSTGGFTDCLLQRGALRVHAIDVGTNQLAWKLRQDPRVLSKERFNARYLKRKDLGEAANLAVLDLSFISLTRVLPAVCDVVDSGGGLLALVKPQFELSRGEVGKGGVVREPRLREQALRKVRVFVAENLPLEWCGSVESCITGADGNVEFFAWMKKKEVAELPGADQASEEPRSSR